MGTTTSIYGNNNTVRSVNLRAIAKSHVTIANAAASPVRLYYKVEKMNLQDLIEGSQLKNDESIIIMPGEVKKTPLDQSLHVTGFQVQSENTFCCHGKDPMSGLNNLLVEAVQVQPKSYIITANNNVKLAKIGEIWVDQDGVDHTPKI